MENTPLSERVQRCEIYISLGEKLQEVVKDPEGLDILAKNLEPLKEMHEHMQKLLESNERVERSHQNYAEEFASEHGGKEQALKYIKTPKKENFYLEAVKCLGDTALMAVFTAVVFPFSRKKSKEYFEVVKMGLDTTRTFYRLGRRAKKSKAETEKAIHTAHKLEFAEARFADFLKEKSPDASDDDIYRVVTEPEVLYMALIDFVKSNYAPEL